MTEIECIDECMAKKIGYALCDPDCRCKCECGIHKDKKTYLDYYSLKEYNQYVLKKKEVLTS